ncbi:MAG: family 16 glycoside hydrolase [Bryobacteraceae bacterium]|nr:family 16 glycoside hydrolase [Bryobacteraceae bacterium]
MELSRRSLLATMLAAPVGLRAAEDEGWIPLFDGKTLNGWKAQNPDSWKVVDGALAADGPRSHLYYTGSVRDSKFRNFELKATYKTKYGANSGIYIHTKWQDQGWPAAGFEVQVNNSHGGENQYRERKKGGSLYSVRNVYKSFAPDEQWNEMYIAVRGKWIQIRLNGVTTVNYVQPDNPPQVDKGFQRLITEGTFALQCHDPESKAWYRDIRVRPLPDNMRADMPFAAPVVDQNYIDWLTLGNANMPLVDYHTHEKGITKQEMVANAQRLGFMYGIALNVGKFHPANNDGAVREWLATMKGLPVFTALQGEGREWVQVISKKAMAEADYCFTDSMTWTDDSGRRMRLWIKEETQVGDRQKFMDTFVDRTVKLLRDEPIDIYANPTFLPDEIAPIYAELWTQSRMSQVIEAAVKNDVAIELNNRYKIPSLDFVKLAKQAGAKFSFGTNNSDGNLGRMEYALQMVKGANLTWRDIFIPHAGGNRAKRWKL